MRNDILYGIGMLLAASGVQAHDGRVYVSGTITDNTCSLSPDSENINVAMARFLNGSFIAQATVPHGNLLLSIYKTAAALPAA
ncbi:type 1 fimbrae adaptor subunit FimF [Salmonella enterica subsp. enterica]|uniref:Type 1 fimbrae adaptor subunit FimF n=1 Tax=Salmonella enterica I TaxID=59201 RepID=A0A447PMW9_SALET|nr:type 1 fimbrae adaptor subunit FimF [Salmonella enterica subsp. enterica]